MYRHRLSRFPVYIVNEWGDPALYSVVNVLVVAACLSFLPPFVLFLVLRSLRFSLFLMYTVYYAIMYIAIGRCINSGEY